MTTFIRSTFEFQDCRRTVNLLFPEQYDQPDRLIITYIKIPPPLGLPLRLSVGGCWMCLFDCCFCWFIGVITYSSTCAFALRFALCGFACACTCTYARCQAHGTDINHIAQQANQLVNLVLTGLMNLAANVRSTLITKPVTRNRTTHPT